MSRAEIVKADSDAQARSCISSVVAAVGFSIATLSVNSSTKQRASTPESRRASPISSTNAGRSCTLETLTEIQRSLAD